MRHKNTHLLVALVLFSLSARHGFAASQTWSGGASGNNSGFLTAGNWVGNAIPGNNGNNLGTNVATLPSTGTNNPNTTIGIAVAGQTNSTQTLGALEFTGTIDRAFENSSAANGTVRLNGNIVNGVSNVVLRNSASGKFTLLAAGSAGGVLDISLGNTTENIVNIDSTGDIVVNSAIRDATGVSGVAALKLGGAGTGKLILAGANTYTGGTIINSGKVLQIGNGGSAGSIADTGTMTNDGTLIFNLTGTPSYNGAIVGNGSLLKMGSGVLTLGNAGTTYSGGTTISQGSIRWNNNQTLGTGTVTINDAQTSGNTLLFKNNSGTLANDIVVANFSAGTTVTIGNDAGTNDASTPTVYTGGITLNRNANLKSGDGAFVSFRGVISGSGGVTINGTGTVELTKNNSYAGNTTINLGKLQVNNPSGGSGTGTGNVVVNNDGTLSGTGSVAGSVTLNSTAHLAPGTSIESFAIGGNLSFNATSNLDYEINSSGTPAADLVIVDGALSIVTTAKLNVTDLADPDVALGATKFTLISYAGALTGNFENLPNLSTVVVGPNSFTLRYDDTTPGMNFSGEVPAPGGSQRYVTLSISAVPEASVFLFGSVLCLVLGTHSCFRRSSRA